MVVGTIRTEKKEDFGYCTTKWAIRFAWNLTNNGLKTRKNDLDTRLDSGKIFVQILGNDALGEYLRTLHILYRRFKVFPAKRNRFGWVISRIRKYHIDGFLGVFNQKNSTRVILRVHRQMNFKRVRLPVLDFWYEYAYTVVKNAVRTVNCLSSSSRDFRPHHVILNVENDSLISFAKAGFIVTSVSTTRAEIHSPGTANQLDNVQICDSVCR